MVQTLNKACGDAGISEQRLDKSFEVWYPTLEKELTELKNESSNTNEEVMTEDNNYSSEILEEILELSRDNQKLLRNPDSKLYDDMEKVKESLERISMKNEMLYEKRRMSRKYSSMFFWWNHAYKRQAKFLCIFDDIKSFKRRSSMDLWYG